MCRDNTPSFLVLRFEAAAAPSISSRAQVYTPNLLREYIRKYLYPRTREIYTRRLFNCIYTIIRVPVTFRDLFGLKRANVIYSRPRRHRHTRILAREKKRPSNRPDRCYANVRASRVENRTRSFSRDLAPSLVRGYRTVISGRD